MSAPAPELALSQKPQTQVDSSAFTRPLQVGIASGLEQLGQGAETLAEPLAKAQAQSDLKAVTLDAQGYPQIATAANSVILGKAGQDYNDAILQGGKAMLTSKVAADVTDLHAQYPNDAQLFQTAVKAKAQAYQGMYPGALGNSLADTTNNLGQQHYANIVENDIRRNTAESLQAINTHIDDTNNQLRAMARQGAIQTPEYDRLLDQLEDSYSDLGSNKSFGYSQDKIDSEKAHAYDMLNGEYVVGRVDDTFNKKGKAAAQEILNSQIRDNPNLQLSDVERNNLYGAGMNRLSFLSDEQRANIAALKPRVDDSVKILEAGNQGDAKLSDQQIDATIAQAHALGDLASEERLQAARVTANRSIAFRGLTPDQKSSTLLGAASAGVGGPLAADANNESGAVQFFQSKGWSQAQAAGIVGNLVHESGGRLNPGALNPGDGSDGSDSIGIGQWNGARAAALKQFAAAAGKPVGDFGTQLAFVQHELETSESAAATRLKGTTTPQDAAAAFAIGYERPQGFQTGDIRQVLGGQNRVDQANRLAGGGASTAAITSFGQPYTPAEAVKNPFIPDAAMRELQISKNTEVTIAKALAGNIDNNIAFTNQASPQLAASAATVLQLAEKNPAELGEIADKMTAKLAGIPAGYSAAGNPDGGANMLDAARQMAVDNPDRLTTLIGESMKRGVDAGRQQLKDDPFEYAHQNEWITRKPAPFDFTDAGKLQQSMNEHGQAATLISSRPGGPPISAISPTELPQLKSVMTSGTIDQRTALVGAIANAGMPQPVLKATLQQLSSPKETLPLAVAGSLVKDSPDAARSVIEGQAAMQAEPKYAPNKDDFPTELAKAIPYNELPAPQAREGIAGAVQAYYAKQSAVANDTTGILNQGRLQDAISKVTGGVSDYRGAKIIAPWYGATPEATDSAIRKLTDADFTGASTADGKPFPVELIKPSFMSNVFGTAWRLQSVGDGKYNVFSGADDKRGYLIDPQGNRFVLELGSKRGAVEQEAAGRVSMNGSQRYISSDTSSCYLIGNP